MMIRRMVLGSFLGAFFANGDACAQAANYTAIVQAMETWSSPKALFSSVADRYPDAEMVHDAASQTFTIQTALPLSFDSLEAMTIPAGYYLISLQQEQ